MPEREAPAVGRTSRDERRSAVRETVLTSRIGSASFPAATGDRDHPPSGRA